jgi:hypothetical protein
MNPSSRSLQPREPCHLGALVHFENLDFVHVLQGDVDVVEPFEQALLARRIDIEIVVRAVRRGYSKRAFGVR